jgi:hypothetical protein
MRNKKRNFARLKRSERIRSSGITECIKQTAKLYSEKKEKYLTADLRLVTKINGSRSDDWIY